MTSDLSTFLTVEDLATHLQIPVERTKRLARDNDWPCIRFSRKTVRYSADNVAAIVAMHTQVATPAPVGLPGQTARSRAKAS